MPYFPYFRGKQYELIAIRETAQVLRQAQFTPVIEPVKKSMAGIEKALDRIVEEGGSAILLLNPEHGFYQENGRFVSEFVEDRYTDNENISLGILLNDIIKIEEIFRYVDLHGNRISSLVHAGYSEAKSLANNLTNRGLSFRQIFFEEYSGKLYRKHFSDSERILLRDGFQKRRNRDHPEEAEFFSDLHVTFDDEGMDGFGDFLIVGDDYSESGGPAYAVAIHITYVDHNKDGEMHIHHFKSIRQDDAKDPAGKFAEALQKLVDEFNRDDSQLFHSSAITEFLDLHQRGHFPGLGYVKKLSMKHHIETLADYFSNQ